MRGKGWYMCKVQVASRITPAYAGKSIQLDFLDRPVEDHPRLCGEKKLEVSGKRSNTGSPPPMRGKDPPMVGWIGQLGITPAYAGKRSGRH